MKEIATITRTNQILKQFHLTAKKNYGQNFLIDLNLIRQIVEVSQIDKDSAVIEIGPGIGGLTQQLANAAGKVIAFEIDQRLKPVLSSTLKDLDNVEIIFDDILKVDLQEWYHNLSKEFSKVHIVANLPYYITTPILMKLLESRISFTNIVVMMQKEVALRLSAVPNTKEYNALSISTQYFSTVEIAINIPKTVFIPQPNVDSAVVLIKPHMSHKLINEELFFEVLKASFKQRRKTILNNLKEYLGDKEKAEVLLNRAGIDFQIRAEALSFQDFEKLTNCLLEGAL